MMSRVLKIWCISLFIASYTLESQTGLSVSQEYAIAYSIFNPSVTAYPTTSINEAAVESLFGPSGLNIDALLPDEVKAQNISLVTYIKQFYFYLEYITRLELAAKLLTLAKEKGITYFKTDLFSWDKLLNDVGATLDEIQQVTNPDYDDFKKSALNFFLQNDLPELFEGTNVPAVTFELLKTTSLWTAFQVTTDNLIQSDFWQNYLKYTIIGTYQIDFTLITSIDLNQNLIFKYIPKIETAYYSKDFTELRNQAELLRVSLLLNESYRTRLQKQLREYQESATGQAAKTWPDITDIGTKKFFAETADDVVLPDIENFMDTTFYHVAEASGDPNFLTKTINWSTVKDFISTTFNATATQKNNVLLFSLSSNDLALQAQATLQSQFPWIIATVQDKQVSIVHFSPYQIDSQGNLSLVPSISLPSPYPEYMTALGMIMILQKLTYALFEPKGTGSDALTQTVLTLIKTTNKPVPGFMVYSSEDYLPLEDLTTIVTTQASSWTYTELDNLAAGTQTNVVTPQSINFSGSEAVIPAGFWDDVKNFFKDAWATVEDVAEAEWDEAKVFYYGITGNVTKQKQASDEAETYWDQMKTDSDNLIKDAVDIVAWPVDKVMDAVLGIIDKGIDALGLPEANLKDDFDTFLQAASDTLVDWLVTEKDFFLTQVEGVSKLTADGAALVVRVAIDIGSGQFSKLPEDISQGAYNIVNDAISTLVESVSLLYQDISKLVTDTLNLVASVIQILTNIIIDLYTFYAEAAATFVCYGLGANCDPTQITQQVGSYLENHKNTISQLVTAGILIGATVATGGGAMGVAFAAGFSAFSIIGGYQQDEAQIDTRSEQTEFLKDYTTYVVNKEQIDQQQQKFISDELSAKFGAEINNRERTIGFYQNYLNDTLTGIREQLNMTAGQWQAQLLTPNEQGHAYADVGSLYGFTTNYYDLNIGQGFGIYSKPRDTISQEIAELPSHTPTTTTGSDVISDTKFWFNQRITTDLAAEADPLEVEVKFQTIYLLDNFYVGLYIGGSPLDIENILKENIGNLDQPHLAKMLVYAKESKDEPVYVGLYEFESQANSSKSETTYWLNKNISGAPTLNPGVWYHMKASLSGSSLQYKIWQDGSTEPGWQTQAVTPCPQQTFGMVFSGAAGEFTVISPDAATYKNFVQDTTMRSEQKGQMTEQQREINARIKMNRLITPKNFTTFNLTPMDQYEIIKGHYLYNIDTKLTDPDLGADYVTTGVYTSDTNYNLLNIGKEPDDTVDALVSMVTGKGYKNINGALVERGWAQNITTVYKNTFGNLSDQVSQKLDAAIASYAQQMMGPPTGFSFGSFSLTPTSINDIKNHQYIYVPVQGTQGPLLMYDSTTPLKDASGNILQDSYFYFTLMDSSQTPQKDYYTGMSYQDINEVSKLLNMKVCMISLVTLNYYGADQASPLESGYDYVSLDTLSADLQKKITDAQKVWKDALKTPPPAPKVTTPKEAPAVSTPTGGGTGTSIGGGAGWGPPATTGTTQESFNARQTQASGGAGWG